MSNTFFGIPVTGDITSGRERKEQRPVEEFAPLVQAILDDRTIVEFGWHQYTPYFSDGDPCVFSVHNVWFRTEDQDVDLDEWDLEFYGSHDTIGSRNYRWVSGKRIPGAYTGPDEQRYDRCLLLSDALESDSFDDALMNAFGDHSEIRVNRDGIHVEFYEHD